MKKSKLILILFAATALIGCQKEPSASFTTDKTEYTAGETIKLTNTSTEGHSYLWTMPDGQMFTDENINFMLNGTEADGSMTFKLDAFSKNGKKEDQASQTVNIKAAKGDAIFWQAQGSGFGVTVVEINGITSNITGEYTGAPGCGSVGCAVFNGLKVGSYSYTASDGGSNWAGTVTINNNGCSQIQLN